MVFDTIRRYLIYRGYKVIYVQNFTDVDDKIINRANEEGVEAHELAQRYIEEYFKDADALNVMRADKYPKVSEHIPEIIQVISTLVEKGHGYVRESDVFFGVATFPEYGKLSGRSLDDMLSGARVEVDARKEQPVDFALWKKAKPGEPSWESPWGKGRPGWHIECSVMSTKYLGMTFDIHGGGADLIFPHHENEIAQAEAFSDRPFVKYWLHNGFITVNREKMSKSLGNFFVVRDILDKYPAEVVRLYLLSTHYRSPLDFDNTKLDEAGKALDRLRNSRAILEEAMVKAEKVAGLPADVELAREIADLGAKFVEAMDDDFNTALAFSQVFNLARLINRYLAGGIINSLGTLEDAARLFDDFLEVLGLNLKTVADDASERVDESVVGEIILDLVEFRKKARQEKDYRTGDLLRDLLYNNGISLEDYKEGSRVKFESEPVLSSLMADILALRADLRKEKAFTRADQLRDILNQYEIVIDDTREGSSWRFKA